jgi:hypothetical protein
MFYLQVLLLLSSYQKIVLANMGDENVEIMYYIHDIFFFVILSQKSTKRNTGVKRNRDEGMKGIKEM